MKVGNAIEVLGRRNTRFSRVELGPLVGIVAQYKAEQQTGHDDIAQTEHAKVTRVLHAREDQLSGQGQLGDVPGAVEVQPLRHQIHRVVGRLGGHTNHHIGGEDVGGEEDPEDVVDEETGEEEGGYLQTGQTDEGDEGDAEAHAHGVHQQPVTGEHPNADDRH